MECETVEVVRWKAINNEGESALVASSFKTKSQSHPVFYIPRL